MSDPLFRLLQRLPEAEPNRDRADRTRARCHAALRAQATASPQVRPPAPAPSPSPAACPRLALPETVRALLRVYGIL